jgi:hypothetical protein
MSVAGLAPASGLAAETNCAPRPESATGYQVSTVGADRIAAPPSTPPIAVLDSGVASVPELAGRIREGANVVTGGRDTSDVDGHGTAVATVAAGAAGGVRGIAPTAPIIPIKIFNPRGEAGVREVIEGIRTAVKLGARVINISAAIPARQSDAKTDRQIQDAIWSAVTKGVVVVAPTGNEAAQALDVPAVYPHVLAVAATDEGNAHADFSNTGVGVDLAAPGANITTASPSSLCSTGYVLVSGTSFAAPAVAGAAAMVLQRHPELDVTQVADMVRLRGLRVPAPGWNLQTGFGLLDVPSVLSAPVPVRDDPEVNDTVAWARKHAAVLTPSRHKRSVLGRVSPRLDPRDVYRLRLARGDRFEATVKSGGATLRLVLSDGRRVLRRGTRVRAGIPRSGTYFVSVSLGKGPPEGVGYVLQLQR